MTASLGFVLGPGHRLMSPGTRHARFPAEVLRASKGDYLPNFAHRAKIGRATCKWKLQVEAVSGMCIPLTASKWNAHSMVDSEGPIEVASQWYNDRKAEDRKIAEEV